MYLLRAGRPAMPMATLVCPSRHARPNVSVMTTATVARARFAISSRMRAAEASGSRGSRTTVSGAPALERSTPALAQTNPCRVSTIRTPRSHRTICVDHHRTPPETAAVVVLAEADREGAIFIAKQLNGGLAPFPDRGRFFDDLALSPWHRKRPRDLARRSLHIGKC